MKFATVFNATLLSVFLAATGARVALAKPPAGAPPDPPQTAKPIKVEGGTIKVGPYETVCDKEPKKCGADYNPPWRPRPRPRPKPPA